MIAYDEPMSRITWVTAVLIVCAAACTGEEDTTPLNSDAGKDVTSDTTVLDSTTADVVTSSDGDVDGSTKSFCFVGTTVGIPDQAPFASIPELQPYRTAATSGSEPTGRENLLVYMDSELRTASGFTDKPMFRVDHTFANPIPTTWASQPASRDAARGMKSALNVKFGNQLVPLSNGDAAAIAKITTFVTSVKNGLPSGKTLWLTFEHEPEDSIANGDFTAAQWRKAVANAMKATIDARGGADIRPTFTLMSYTWVKASGRNPKDYDLTAELAAAGVPLTDVVFAPDGYSPTPATRHPADVFGPPFTDAKAWGFTRFGIFETACKSKDPADNAAAPAWVDDLAKLADQWKLELVLWFASGVGQNAAPEGWWTIYSVPMQKRLGNFAHFGGYAP